MSLTQAQKTKLEKLKVSGSWKADCCICGKPVYSTDCNTEYAKTKRGTENFFHRDCVRRWGE